jgi:late competence protein required for DNA uptake (superfamily II DNA/RNA helicase)
MVKINISIEGDDIEDIISDLFSVGKEFIQAHRTDIKEILEILADESIDILMDRTVLERGAKLYRKLNTEINYQYRNK